MMGCLDYVAIPKAPFNDSRLSLKAKGLYGYIYSLCDTTREVPKKNVLSDALSLGTHAMYSAFKELRDNGYIEYKVLRDKEGKVKEHQTYLR